MQNHNHHHIPRPGDAFDEPRRGHHTPFTADSFGGDRPHGHRSPFAGGRPGTDPRRAYRDPLDGPRGARFGRGPQFGPGFGPAGFGFGPGFGPGGPRGGFEGGHGHHGRRAGRGDIRAAVLLLLAEQPRHGYELIREISERTDGAWTPSPGAIYPALSLLEDEGLVTIAAEGGRKLASLSDAGRAYVTAHADEIGDPFADATARTPRSRWALRDAVRGLMGASMQVAQNGDETQVARALVVLDQARKDLYRVLAGDSPADGDRAAGDAGPADASPEA